MDDRITIETDLFEHRKAGRQFINPCCFGEDFRGMAQSELSPLVGVGFVLSDPIQEDYGRGFWANHGQGPFWIAVSLVGEGPQERPGQWVVSVAYDAGLNLIKRLFHQSDTQAFAELRDLVWQAIRSNRAITVL